MHKWQDLSPKVRIISLIILAIMLGLACTSPKKKKKAAVSHPIRNWSDAYTYMLRKNYHNFGAIRLEHGGETGSVIRWGAYRLEVRNKNLSVVYRNGVQVSQVEYYRVKDELINTMEEFRQADIQWIRDHPKKKKKKG